MPHFLFSVLTFSSRVDLILWLNQIILTPLNPTCWDKPLPLFTWLTSLILWVFAPQVSPDFIRSGEFTLERMGVVYKAKAHLKSPFDPDNKRVKGIYSAEWTSQNCPALVLAAGADGETGDSGMTIKLLLSARAKHQHAHSVLSYTRLIQKPRHPISSL